METEKASSKKIIINYGLILGLVSVLFGAIIYATGMYKDPHWSIAILSFLITIGVLVYGIKAFKTSNNGFLNLSDALKVGIGIALISGLVSSVWNLTLTTVIEPDYTQQVMQVQKDKYLESSPDLTQEQIDQMFAIPEKMQSPPIAFALGIIGSLFIGFIISLIAGLIMQKKQEIY
ncbi:DUF4199 domain-containing protein [Aquimarina gracilis]|uniref:DUF4199 domain-containing protein n=1 Tax=Aquimarina gracilis TaxID=874422 RepID=A0ABU5ZW85_9FLAO|nr:DUF4199 domain-containing protein [Aquimarina gracilis]MEB3346111.1 DUF4199 domain-containing protein [Aquimarina gracilis]